MRTPCFLLLFVLAALGGLSAISCQPVGLMRVDVDGDGLVTAADVALV
ncbi:MAG: hypothetical protein GY723_13865, partial [bacterium]|nr:hypothetical protein [bacterium]